ncbi:hypothetical protein [Actinomycetospora termitidis]|uniref:Hemerythrin-like domain-containing protein n=1 Tax=Actinomycetospora termitidis TaxID=3053470 RepID=A0ABT7MGQ6_9PSEU|nr:hypothetical protein [Actinomycetospora sp. Odt1-22]MDL5159855.1 hypothetical protein [Actinomycetospora sp. Odt1-22]
MSPDVPTSPEDLITLRLARRVLRRDVGRVADLAGGLLAGTHQLDPRRLTVFSTVTEQLCDELVGNQAFESVLLWPTLERHAPEAVAAVAPDARHVELRGVFDEARRASRTVVRNLTARPAALATATDHRDTGSLARAWDAVRDGLGGFFDATDDLLVTVVTTAVPRAEWVEVLEEARRRLPDRKAAAARVLEVATPEELALLGDRLGRRAPLGRRGAGRRRRTDDALLFGADGG